MTSWRESKHSPRKVCRTRSHRFCGLEAINSHHEYFDSLYSSYLHWQNVGKTKFNYSWRCCRGRGGYETHAGRRRVWWWCDDVLLPNLKCSLLNYAFSGECSTRSGWGRAWQGQRVFKDMISCIPFRKLQPREMTAGETCVREIRRWSYVSRVSTEKKYFPFLAIFMPQ